MKAYCCKRRFFLTLWFILVFSLVLQNIAFAIEFKDISDKKYNWARPYIEKMALFGVIKGTTNDSFSPDLPITRAQSIVMIIRLLGEEEVAKNKKMPTSFKNEDLVPEWARGYIAHAVDRGIISGSDLSGFRANDAVKRHEIAVFAVKALGLGDKAENMKNVDLSFKDTFAIPLDSRAYVQLAVEKGVIKGFPDSTFKPNDKITRAQMAVVLNNLGKHISSPKLIEGVLEGKKEKLLPSVTVKLDKDDFKTFTVNDKTVFYKIKDQNLEKITLKDLNSKDKITLLPDSKGDSALYIEVTESANVSDIPVKEDIGDIEKEIEEPKKPNVKSNSTIKAALRAVIPSANLILIDNLDTLEYERYELSSNLEVKKYGKKVELLELQNGDFIVLTLKNGKVTKVEVKEATLHTKGKIADINFSSLYPELIIKEQGKKTKFEVAYDALVVKNGHKSDIMDLRVDDEVTLYIEYGKVVSIISQSNLDYISGMLKRITISDDTTISIEDKKGREYTTNITEKTRLTKDGNSIEVGDLRKGYHLEVVAEGNEAVSVDCVARETQDTVKGTVQFVNPNLDLIVIAVENEIGESQLRYLNYNNNTVLLRQTESINIKRVKKGDEILAIGDYSGGVFFADILINLTIYK